MKKFMLIIHSKETCGITCILSTMDFHTINLMCSILMMNADMLYNIIFWQTFKNGVASRASE